jgi:RNA polymerase sigma-70 factor (ECF subfamily)
MFPKADDASSTSLGFLQGLQSNDSAAWQRLVDLYGPLLDHWCRRSELQEADAADVRQEVLLSVARKIGEFRWQSVRGSFRAWLRTITRNKIADLARRRRVQPAEVADDELKQLPASSEGDLSGDEEGVVESQILYRRALALIQADFEESTWKAFLSVVIDGRSATSTASDLGVSVNVVYLAKSRVLARLREEFKALLDA